MNSTKWIIGGFLLLIIIFFLSMSFFQSIYYNPISIILFTLVFSSILFFIFKYLKISSLNVKKIEFLCLSCGLVSLVAYSCENRQSMLPVEQEGLKNNIRCEYTFIISCEKEMSRQYNKSPYSRIDFEETEVDGDKLRNWITNKEKVTLDPLDSIPLKPLQLIEDNEFSFKTDFYDNIIEEYNTKTKRINKKIDKFYKNKKRYDNYSTKEVEFFQFFFLHLTITIALALAYYNIKSIQNKSE